MNRKNIDEMTVEEMYAELEEIRKEQRDSIAERRTATRKKNESKNVKNSLMQDLAKEMARIKAERDAKQEKRGGTENV